MHVYVTARHIELSVPLRTYVEEHLVAPVRTHGGPQPIRMEVQLFEESERTKTFGCHVTVELPRKKGDLNIRELSDDLYAAIDLAKDRIVRLLVEDHERVRTLRRHPMRTRSRLARALSFLRGRTRA